MEQHIDAAGDGREVVESQGCIGEDDLLCLVSVADLIQGRCTGGGFSDDIW